MQRSTISLIVELGENWLVEGAALPLPRTAPTFLRLNEDRVVMGIAIRPSQITIALADVNGEFLSQAIISTHATAKAALAAIISLVEEIVSLVPDKTMEGIGVSLPGPVHHATGRQTFARNLKWAGQDLKTPLIAGTGRAGVAGPDGAPAGGGSGTSAQLPKKKREAEAPRFS